MPIDYASAEPASSAATDRANSPVSKARRESFGESEAL